MRTLRLLSISRLMAQKWKNTRVRNHRNTAGETTAGTDVSLQVQPAAVSPAFYILKWVSVVPIWLLVTQAAGYAHAPAELQDHSMSGTAN